MMNEIRDCIFFSTAGVLEFSMNQEENRLARKRISSMFH